MTRIATRAALTAVLSGGLVLLAACGTPTVSQSDVESQISSQLEAKVGQKPDSVSCPSDLEGKVGASEKCKLTADGKTYGVTVKVTAVDGNKVNFSIKVDDQAS